MEEVAKKIAAKCVFKAETVTSSAKREPKI